jgi:hypothetical protein
VERSRRVLALALPALACSAWTLHAGKDLNWDLLNYHYYLPFELLEGRLRQDFFAASAQSYLNPVGYLPFYLMVAAGWHAVLVSVLLAAVHGLSIAFLFLVSWRLFAHLQARERAVFSCLASALGAATGLFWPTVGTSFLDPLLVPLMLGGLLLLLEGGERSACRATFAGMLFGAAAALKYSNAIFVLAALPLAAAMPGATGAARLRLTLCYAAGAGGAIATLAGPWMVLLAREFGSPVFPLFNAWFRSPDALPVNLLSARFSPGDLASALLLPFRMILPDRSVYAEILAPDIRFAALSIAGVSLLVAGTTQRFRSAGNALTGTDARLLAFFGAGTVLWLASSGNGRYALVLMLLAGACLARLVERLLPVAAARIAVAALLAVQIAMVVLATPARWFIAEPWSRSWLPYEVPEPVLAKQALYLTVELLPMAVLAPLAHPGSAFVNFRGQNSIPPDSPRLKALLERHRGQVRTLGRGLKSVDGKLPDDQLEAYDATLLRIGYRVNPADCLSIAWRPDDADWLSRAANAFSRAEPSGERLSVVTCALLPAVRDPAEAAKEARASALFDRLEKSCPRLFRGQTAVTEPFGRGWSRYYVGLDARLEALGSRVVLNRFRVGTHSDLGAVTELEQPGAPIPAACRET